MSPPNRLSWLSEVLELSRGNLYYNLSAVMPADLAIMRRIDELHLDYPFAGSRMLRDLLRGEGVAIGRERVARMMRRMGIEANYRGPNTSKPSPLATRFTRIFYAACRSIGRTRCGRWTSPTFPWRAASCTWRRSWTGSVVGFCRGGCRSAWKSISTLRRLRRRLPNTAGRRFSTATRGANSPAPPSPACC